MRDENGGGFAVAASEVVPDEHHGDAAGEADDDQTGAVLGQVGEEQPGESEHEGGPDHPVEDEGGAHELAVGGDLADLGVADLGQYRVHHGEQPDGDRVARRCRS